MSDSSSVLEVVGKLSLALSLVAGTAGPWPCPRMDLAFAVPASSTWQKG
jgi:hypothetical protein